MNEYRIPIPDREFAPPVYYCKRAKKEFVLDGNLDKEFWADAPFTELFVDIEGEKRPAPRFETRVKMLWDQENLYFGAKLWGDEIWATLTERDCVIFQDNDFEIFIDPDSDTHQYFEFEMNALNTVWDLFLTKPYRDKGGRPLNGWDIKGLRSAVRVDGTLNDAEGENRSWSVEVVMPFKALQEMAEENRSPKAGEYYRVNFSRVQWKVDKEGKQYRKQTDKKTGRALPEDNWVWAPTGLINIHYPELWGFLFFTENGEEYPIPEAEYVKWELRRIYYYEHKYFDDYGCYTTDIEALGMDREPRLLPEIEVASESFVLSCACPTEEKRVLLYEDGRTEVLGRQEIERRLRRIPADILKQTKPEELPYVKFLYENAPVTDLKDCEPEYFLKAVRQALYVREHTPWGKEIPEELFLNYVLFYRVNNEHIEFYQEIFWEALKEELWGGEEKTELSLYEAAVKVNYWCFKQATYQATNERTASALTVIKNAFGRCGEESVLAVAALRSVGIPARQCYAPRWSHCDDNHAWAEVYTGEDWHFLGACEPELRLDRGWFRMPASKAMLVHTRAYTNRECTGERVVREQRSYKELNELHRYAKTREITVQVKDGEGKPVKGASVRMEVVNYSEFFPVFTLETDEKGEVKAETGYGDLLLHASRDGVYVRGFFDGRKEEPVQLVLEQKEPESEGYALTLSPPAGGIEEDEPSSVQEKELEQRLFEEASRVRKEREAGFYTGEKAREAAREMGREDLAAVLEAARGNGEEILGFLRETPKEQLDMAMELLLALESKDLSDTGKEVLKEHLNHALPYAGAFPEEVFVSGLLNPRIGHEVLTAYKTRLAAAFTEKEKEAFREEPKRIWQWVQGHIFCFRELQEPLLRQTPLGTFFTRGGNSLSRKTLFIAICRSLGIPAKLDETEEEPCYYKGDRFWRLGEEKSASLTLLRGDGRMEYYTHVSVGRLVNGVYETLALDRIPWEGNKFTCQVCPGHYRVITANRQPDESCQVQVEFLEISKGEQAQLQLTRKAGGNQGKQAALADGILYRENGEVSSVAEEIGAEESCALCYIRTGEEPTEHLLNEIAQSGEYFKQAGKRLLLVVQEEAEREDRTLNKAVRAVGETVQVLTTRKPFSLEKEYEVFGITDCRLPLVIITKNGKGSYGWSGYLVGIGDMILKCFENI